MDNTVQAIDLNQLTHAVIGAAIEVHRVLGPGFLQSAYEEALCLELSDLGIPFNRQQTISVVYKQRQIGQSRLDLVVDAKVLVELISVDKLAAIQEAQVISYLRMTGLRLGLLINFNVPVLKDGVKRIILD